MFDYDSVLTRLDHDHTLLSELVSCFLSDLPNWLDTIRQAIKTNDLATIVQPAHTLKGA